MGRHAVDFTFTGSYYDDEFGSPSTNKEYVKGVRDKVRVALESSDFIVSDIAEWKGRTSSSNYGIGYGFVVKFGDSEWLFSLGTALDGNRYIGYIVGDYDSTVMDDLFEQHNGTSSNYRATAQFFIHYNNGSGSWGMGFDDDNNMTYVDGDFQKPQHNPGSDNEVYDFFPTSGTYGSVDDIFPAIYHDDSSAGDGDDFCRYLFIFDDDKGNLTWYGTDDGQFRTEFVVLSGEIFDNYESSDENTKGLFSFTIDRYGVMGNKKCLCFNDLGDLENFELEYHTNFTHGNVFDSGGNFKWNSVQCYTQDYMKGVIDNDLVRVTGAYDSVAHTNIVIEGPSGPFYRVSNSIAMPYADGIERFPFPGEDV